MIKQDLRLIIHCRFDFHFSERFRLARKDVTAERVTYPGVLTIYAIYHKLKLNHCRNLTKIPVTGTFFKNSFYVQ